MPHPAAGRVAGGITPNEETTMATTIEAGTANCPVKVAWRIDGRYGESTTDLAELREGRRYGSRAALFTAFIASTPRGDVILDDYIVRDADGTVITSDDDSMDLFLRVADRACRGLRSHAD